MKMMARRRRTVGNLLETLEPRQLLSATLLKAFGLGTTSPYGLTITGMGTDAAGDVVVAGMFQGTVDIDPGVGVQNITSQGKFNYDGFLIKYSAAGAVLWCRTLSSPGDELPGGLLVDNAGNIVLTGQFSGTLNMDTGGGTTAITSMGSRDALVAKYDAGGNLAWAKSFGGSGDDSAEKIVSDRHGGYVITGNFQNTADLDPGSGVSTASAHTRWDSYITRLDGNGNMLWSDQFSTDWQLYVSNIAVDSAGAVYMAGSMSGVCDFDPGRGVKLMGNATEMLGYAAKYSAAGRLVWVKQFGEHASGVLMADMTLDAQNNMILVGSFGGSGDFDPNGGVKILTEHQTPDAFTGFVMKLGPAGGFKWAGALTGDWWSDAFGVATDGAGNIYVTGEYNGTHCFDIVGNMAGPAGDTLTALGQDDAFLAKYDGTGRLKWVESMGGVGYDHGLHVNVGPGNTLYMYGYYNMDGHFGAAAGGVDLTALGTADGFVAVFGQTPAVPTATLSVTQTSTIAWRTRVLTATLAGLQGMPTGRVVFYDGSRVVGRGTVNAAGVASVWLNGLRSGVHGFTAVYLGDGEFAGVSSEMVSVVVR